MVSRNIKKDEVREFIYEVKSCDENEIVVIMSAHWKLIRSATKEVVSSGSCTVRENEISMIITFNDPGDFILQLTAEIPPETFIERTNIRVVE